MKKGFFLFVLKTMVFPLVFVLNPLGELPDVMADPEAKAGHDKIKTIEDRLSLEKQKLETFDSHEKGLLEQIATLEREVAATRSSIVAIKKKLQTEKISIKKLENRLLRLDHSLAELENQSADRLVALYKYARKGYTKVLSDVSDVDQFWRRVKYIKTIMAEDRLGLSLLHDEQSRQRGEISLVEEQLDKKEDLRDEEERRLSELKRGLEKEVIHLMKIHREKEFYETAVKELELAAKDLKGTLLDLEKRDSYKGTVSSHFADAKGKLQLPLEGKVIRGSRFLSSAKLSPYRGVFIESSSDTRVKAIFPGRVDFSGSLKGYGKIVVINHGSRYFTISAHLSDRKRNEGDKVEKGDVIGLVASKGSPNGGKLYFEIRKAGKNLDSLKWLKIN